MQAPRIQLLSAKQIAAQLSVSRPTVYTLMRDHDFPKPIKIGSRSLWYEHEVEAWVQSRSGARNV